MRKAVRRKALLDEVVAGLQRPQFRDWHVPWRLVAAWLRANPYVLLRIDKVISQNVYRFKRNHPDIKVMGFNHHTEEDGRKYAQMFAIYCPTEETRT